MQPVGDVGGMARAAHGAGVALVHELYRRRSPGEDERHGVAAPRVPPQVDEHVGLVRRNLLQTARFSR